MTTAKHKPVFNNFTGGTLTPLLKGRVDLDKYSTGCLEMENMIPLPHGGVTRRPGFQFIAQSGGRDDWNWGNRWQVSRLVPYRFYKGASYLGTGQDAEVIECMLEFGNQKVVAWEDGVLVEFLGDAVEWAMPWTHDYLEDLRWAQYGNRLVFVHPKYQPQTVYRDPGASLATRYKYEEFQHEHGPFRPRNTNEAYIARVNALTGTTTMTHPYLGAVTSQINNSVWKFEHRISSSIETLTQNFDASDNEVATVSGTFTTTGTSDWLVPQFQTLVNTGGTQKNPYARMILSGTWEGSVELWKGKYLLMFGEIYDVKKIDTYSSNTIWESDKAITDIQDCFKVRCAELTSGEINYQLDAYFPKPAKSVTLPSGMSVTLTLTSGWVGTFYIERSWDNGANWDTWQVYTSTDGSTSVDVELENNLAQQILVRVTASPLVSGTSTAVMTTKRLEAGEGTILIDSYGGSGWWNCTVENYPDRPLGEPQGVYSTSDTWRWYEGCWSDHRGWPSQVAFFEDRLVFAGNEEYPNRIWMSKTGDYTDFEVTAEDDSAIDISLNADGLEEIRWMRAEKYLMIGTNNGEWRVGASESNAPVTPSNVSAKMVTNYGSTDIQAVKAGTGVLSVSDSTRKLYEFTTDWQLDGYVAKDLTILADHLMVGGVKRMVYQRDPHRIVWFLRNDGILLGLTYMPEEKIFAWHKHTTRTEDDSSSEITDIAVLPGTYGDDLWLIVERKLLGSSGQWRYVERMGPFYNGSNAHDCTWLDCSTYYNLTSGTTVPVEQLRGWNTPNYTGDLVTYIYAADGAETTLAGWQTSGTDRTYDGGGLQTSWYIDPGVEANLHVWAGIPYTSKVRTMPIEIQTEKGWTLGVKKDIKELVLRVHESFDTMTVGRESASAEAFGLPVAYDYDGDYTIDALPSGYDSEATIYVAATGAGAFTLLALMPSISINQT